MINSTCCGRRDVVVNFKIVPHIWSAQCQTKHRITQQTVCSDRDENRESLEEDSETLLIGSVFSVGTSRNH